MAHLHPLRAWRLAQEPALDLDAVAALLADAETGKKPSDAYLRHIENGINEPGWSLCKRIGALIGVDPGAIKDWQPSAAPDPAPSQASPAAATAPDVEAAS